MAIKFTPLDLLAPIGICLGAAALCFVGGILPKEAPLAARIISIATGVLFLCGIPLWYFVRGKMLKPDFSTKHGLRIKLGKEVNRPTVEAIEKWTDDAVAFWANRVDRNNRGLKQQSKEEIYNNINGVLVVFVDRAKLTKMQYVMAGYTDGYSEIFIGYKSKPADRTEKLFRHELSHVILCKMGLGAWDGGDEHHIIFREEKLGV